MKGEILQILEMQSEGKLTKDQAAELLAALADQAREKDGAAGTHAAPFREAPGPHGETTPPPPGPKKDKPGTPASAAFHDLVDTAIGMGTTVGRVATNWGTQFLNMVHRDEGGNSVTLSKVDSPSGEAFSFRGNIINLAKVTAVTLHQAEFCGNNVNASNFDHLVIRRGRITQCDLNGSSVSNITIEGPEAIVLESASTDVPATGLRSVAFNASKCSRVRLLASSHIETSTIMSSVVKDWELDERAGLRDCRLNDSHVTGMRVARGQLINVKIERSHMQAMSVRDAILSGVSFTGVKSHGLSIVNGKWNNVTFRRDAIGSGSGGRESNAQETLFENCALDNCEFAGCTFKRTTFRNLTLAGVTVRNVDFTGMTLETEQDFRRAAGL